MTTEKQPQDVTTTPPEGQPPEQPPAAPTPEQIMQAEQQADADMEAGFNQARGDEPPAEAKPKEPEPNPAEARPDDAKGDEQPPAEPNTQIGGLTEARVREMLDGRVNEIDGKVSGDIRKLYGKIGELNSLLQGLQTKRGGKIDPSKLKRLNEEFPDIAQMLADDLSGILGEGAATPEAATAAAKPEDINAAINRVAAQIQEEAQYDLLSMRHKDWREVVAKPEFRTWWEALPESERKRLDSNKAVVVAEAFDLFKERQKATPPKQQDNRKRLETNITPQGAGGAPPPKPTDEDAFLSGFKSVRDNRL